MTVTRPAPSAAAWRRPVDPWLYMFGPPPEAARVTLLCLPCAGGNSAMFATWSAHLPGDIGIAAARLPGREARLGEPTFDRMEDFVAAFMPVLRRVARNRYAVLGHSMGALMAYALMQERSGDIPPPVHLFLSAHRPPHLSLGRHAIHEKPTGAFLQAIRSMGGIPDEVWEHEELLDLIVPAMRADFKLCETYPRGDAAPPRPPLAMPVSVFGGRDDATATPEALGRWADLCTDVRGLTTYPGGHFYLRQHQDALLAAVAAALRPAG